MTSELLLHILSCATFSVALALITYFRHKHESNLRDTNDDQPVFKPFTSGYILPQSLLISFLFSFIFSNPADDIFLWIFSVFVQISIYYTVLLFLLPLLRRYIIARTCALLWLTPNLLYILREDTTSLFESQLKISIPEKLVWIFSLLWLAGAVVVTCWEFAEHFRFRNQVLSNAMPVTDERTRYLYDKMATVLKLKNPHLELLLSPAIKTPLSIGLLRRTTKIVLPMKDYSEEELDFIFRHEIIHISRRDASAKFFLVFCTAICWWNPLMWIAMRKSAEDFELSCDETVLLYADEKIRHEYASLLLNTAGDERGFTTCLSASAQALRYRLKNIVAPKKKHSGAIVIGLLTFILLVTNGWITLV